ncbi:MAG: hypothetical protein SFV17_19380 [Candidatus Obscuribacter sp.]|nr:hypothetical protein [Candidatus Obscuribacter sp.]
MLQLTFSMSDSDIENTRQFINNPFPAELCDGLEDWIPTANVVFSIDGQNLSPCLNNSESIPVLEFALKLNEILHTIRSGDKRTLAFSMDAGWRKFVLENEDVIVVSGFYGEPFSASCSLVELKIATKEFCEKLYQDIVDCFPGYFEMMDRLPVNQVRLGETPSQRKIRLLNL